jgi:molecular chaperone DnaK
MKIGEAIYGGQQPGAEPGDAGGAGPSGKTGGSGDKVVDADFEEVKDDKKKSA